MLDWENAKNDMEESAGCSMTTVVFCPNYDILYLNKFGGVGPQERNIL